MTGLSAVTLFNLYTEHIMRNARIKIGGRNINNLRYADTIVMAESEEELKSLLMRMKEENEKAGLKLSIQKTKIIAYGPITSWQIEEEKVEAVTDFLFLDSRITTDSDCSHEIKRCLVLGRKAVTNLVQFSSVTLSCPTLCDPMDCSTPGLPPHHQFLELTQTRVH